MNCSCPNESYNLFHNTFKDCFNSCFPVKRIKLINKNKRSPHITPALIKSIKEKNRLERLSYKWPLTFKAQYTAYRNKLTSLLKEAKKKYYQDQLKHNQGNPKAQWKSINNMLGRTEGTKQQSVELKPFCADIPNKFNDNFLRVGGQTQDNVGNDYLQYLQNSPNYSLYLSPTSQDEIESYLKALKTSSSGYDEISPSLLKHTASIISLPLKHVINNSLKKVYFQKC